MSQPPLWFAQQQPQHLSKMSLPLKPQHRQGLIHFWHDRGISAGTEWEQEIEQQLHSAQIVLLLVSPDFIASDYCYNKEMQRVLEQHARGEVGAIPIILRLTERYGTSSSYLPCDSAHQP